MFFIGFPFSYDEDTRNDILYKNSLLTTCTINGPLIENILGIDEEVDCKKNFNDDEIFVPIRKMRSIEFNINISKIPIVSFLVFITYLSLLNVKNWSQFCLKKEISINCRDKFKYNKPDYIRHNYQYSYNYSSNNTFCWKNLI